MKAIGCGLNLNMVDRKFGEKDPTLSIEEKLIQRFVMEKKVQSLHQYIQY